MDDQVALERQLSVVLDRMAGPDPRFDAIAIVRAAQAHSPRRRFSTMLNATRLIAVGATVALSGWFLVAAVRMPTDGGSSPADIAASPSPSPSAASVALDPCTTAIEPVTGTIIWGYQHPGVKYVQTDVGRHELGFIYQSTMAMSDDRLDGTTIATADWYHGAASAISHGTRTIENEDGSWEGSETLSGTQEDGFRFMSDLVGSGAYAGLSAVLFGGQDQIITGTIYPTEIASCAFAAAE